MLPDWSIDFNKGGIIWNLWGLQNSNIVCFRSKIGRNVMREFTIPKRSTRKNIKKIICPPHQHIPPRKRGGGEEKGLTRHIHKSIHLQSSNTNLPHLLLSQTFDLYSLLEWPSSLPSTYVSSGGPYLANIHAGDEIGVKLESLISLPRHHQEGSAFYTRSGIWKKKTGHQKTIHAIVELWKWALCFDGCRSRWTD